MPGPGRAKPLANASTRLSFCRRRASTSEAAGRHPVWPEALVRPRGLEPPLVAQLAPQASASTNSATAAAGPDLIGPGEAVPVTDRPGPNKPATQRSGGGRRLLLRPYGREERPREGRVAQLPRRAGRDAFAEARQPAGRMGDRRWS